VPQITDVSLAVSSPPRSNRYMSTFVDRIRSRRDAARRSRAIERALRSSPSLAVRNEIMAIANRYQ